MAIEAQVELFQAVKAHTLGLESARGVTSGSDPEDLDRRIEDARQLLEWLSQALEPHPAAFQAAQTPPPSSALTDRDQIPSSAPDPPETSPVINQSTDRACYC
jgi:hypothetical protein